MQKSIYVAAHEIGEYVYCKKSWWLKSHDLELETQQMRNGTIAHENLFSQLSSYKFKLILALFFILISLIIVFFLIKL